MKKLFSLAVALFSAIAGWAQSPYTGVAIEDVNADGVYFLYNVESGMWMQDNDRRTDQWHTRGQLGTRGIDFKFKQDGDAYLLKSPFRSGSFEANDEFNLEGNADNWTFTQVSEKVYKIHHGDHYLGITEGTPNPAYNLYTIDANGDGKDDNNYYLANNSSNGTWMIVSKEERLAKLADASETNKINVTWFISNPDDSNSNERDGDWKRVNHGGLQDHNSDPERGTRVRESWNTDNMSCTQTLTNIPNGIYEFTVQGFYREGENGEIAYNRRKNGEEVHAAKIIANNEVANLMSILDDAVDHEEGMYANQKAADGVWVPREMWNCHRSMNIYGKYKNQPLRVVVTNNTLTIGVKKDSKPAWGDWVMISEYALAYLGMPTDLLTPALENLNAAITAAQGIDEEKLTTAAQNALGSAITAAQGLTESTDVEAITNATNDLIVVINNVKDMNATALKAAVEYMSGRGYDDATANDVLANATTASAVNDAVNGLKVRFKQHVAEKSVKPTIFSMPSQSVVGTDDNVPATYVNDRKDGYYLYNVGTGRWFCGGDDWGAHAAVGFPGIKVTTPEDNWNNGHYNKIVTWLCNGNWNDNHKLGNNGYCDTGGNAWKFWQKDPSQGIYTISNNGNDQGVNESNGFGTKDLVGFNDGSFMRVDVHQAGDNNPNNQWIFVTEAQRDQMAEAAFASATAVNPVDLTWKIQMPGFNQRERVEGKAQNGEVLPWVCNHENYTYDNTAYNYDDLDHSSRHAICDRGRNHADFCVDIYGGGWNDAFSWKQTITDLAPGKYRVKVQGYNNGGDAANKAKLVAGNKSVVLREASSETQLPWVGRLADNTWEAVEYFENGCYWNEVVCTVGSDGELTIGVEAAKMEGDHVVLFDNFRLEYIGENNFAPETLRVRYNGHWDGEEMAVAEDSNDDVKHFHYEGWLSTNRNEGLFINFKSGDDFWCPSETNFQDEFVKLHIADTDVELTDMVNTGSTEAAGYAFTSKTNMVAIDTYFKYDGTVKVVCTDKAADMCGDALYIAAEQKNGWSRDDDKCYVLPKVEEGIYEGTITAVRENEYYDMARLFTKANNGDNDNYIGFSGLVYAADSTYKLSYRPDANFRIRKGEQKVTVNLNEGTVTFKYLGEPSYMYAVGTLVDASWQNNNHDAYKLVETEAGSLIFRGVVKIAEDGDSRFTLFEERSSDGWNQGRWYPGGDPKNITKGEWYTNNKRWGDDSWRIPAGTYMVTMDVANQRILCTDVHTQEVVVGPAGFATFVAEYPYTVIPTGAKVNAAQLNDEYVHLEEMTEVPAGEAVVIVAPAGTYTFTEAAVAKSSVENDLKAATAEVTADGTQYILAQHEGLVGFYKATEGTTIAAGKGYLVIDEGAAVKAFYPFGEETATGIDNVNANDNQEIYNLAGQRISKAVKGINIVNGKKVLK